jgi:hypothetical protein
MHSIVDEVIEQRKNGPDATDMNKDLLGYMLNARDEHNLGLSDENIRDQVITFLIAGHETTSNTLAWTLYELTRHPEVEQKMLQEIVNLGITHDALPTSEQSSSMKYTYQVLKETLRMYSPLRQLGKYCKKGKLNLTISVCLHLLISLIIPMCRHRCSWWLSNQGWRSCRSAAGCFAPQRSCLSQSR